MEKKIVFSENFVWGAATSAYQIGCRRMTVNWTCNDPGKVRSGVYLHYPEVGLVRYGEHHRKYRRRYASDLRTDRYLWTEYL